jgi:ParB family chromosome partitioning protein
LYSEKAGLERGQPTVKGFEGIVELIDIRLVRPSDRTLRDEMGDVEALALSIRQQGLLQPLVVRPMKDYFEIVAGCRRFEALRSIGWKKVPCVVVELTDKQAYVASLTENLQRQSLDPVEEALAYKKYISEFGWGGETDLASKISKSQEYVSQRLALLKLPPDLLNLIRENRLRPTIARELNTIADPALQLSLGLDAFRKQLTVSQVKDLVAEARSAGSESATVQAQTSLEAMLERSKQELSIAKKATLATRVALVKMDSLIEDARSEDEEDTLYNLLLVERQDLHRILDDIIKWKVAKSREVSRLQAMYGWGP